MVTSDKKTAAEYADRLTRYSFIYLAAAIFCAFFGAVYEFFSHGVFSFFMIYAFAIPLAAGSFPLLWIALRTRKHLGEEDCLDDDGKGINESCLNETGIDEQPCLNETGIDEPCFNGTGINEPCIDQAAEAESDGSESWFMDIVRSPDHTGAERRRRIPFDDFGGQEDMEESSHFPKRMFHFPGGLELNAWGSGIAALTVGSIFRGVLDIYGTTNKLVIVYPVVGTVLMTFGLVSYIMGKMTVRSASMKKQTDPQF